LGNHAIDPDLASAVEFVPSDLEFVTYDRRLAAEAEGIGIAVIAPAGHPDC
jgi:hypothetical protein